VLGASLPPLEKVVEGVEATLKLYLEDSYLKSTRAMVVKAVKSGGRYYLVADRTVFHPKGGGQPSDRGAIRGSGYEAAVARAMECRGVVVHWCKPVSGVPCEGEAELAIDWGFRYLLMRRHTAAHLLDYALAEVLGEYRPAVSSWLDHPAYVEFKGPAPGSSEVREVEEAEMRLIEEGLPVEAKHMPSEEVERLPTVKGVRLPKLSRYRVIQIGDLPPIPCGGTHVKNTREVGGFRVLKLEDCGGSFKLYFEV